MLYFEVEVYPQRVVVNEVKKLSMYDHKAIVDGDTWLYKIKRSKLFPPQDKGWHGRGLNALYWHAKNSGSYVIFVPVEYAKRQKKIKRHADQIGLFE
jgi:hypothetical protein